MLWRELVPLAWQVDPCLGLSLLDHFPAVPDVRAGLQRLVLQHAASAEVQALPKAALLLAICVWSFCRAYYFAFYVIEHYVDPQYKFAGLSSFVLYLLRKPRAQLRQITSPAGDGGENGR